MMFFISNKYDLREAYEIMCGMNKQCKPLIDLKRTIREYYRYCDSYGYYRNIYSDDHTTIVVVSVVDYHGDEIMEAYNELDKHYFLSDAVHLQKRGDTWYAYIIWKEK